MGEPVSCIAVCSPRPRPSVHNGHSKGSQWWRRDVHHLRHVANNQRTRCGIDCSDWLVIGEIQEVDDNCCKRCLSIKLPGVS